ncbi:MAG: tetratricopeptide repeat protein [Deltaproteobacteria bacterium]|nr:tetratricopeptide repeat protein [Deltaproteobacteria bacterium]
MGVLHDFQTQVIAICGAIALLCASCATGAVEDPEKQSPEKRSQLLAQIGTQAMMRGDLPQAIEDLHKSLVSNEKNVAAHVNLGLCYWQMGQKKLAMSSLERALELDPKNADAHINMGTIAFAQNNLSMARQHYQSAIDNLEFKTRHRALTDMAQLDLRENNTDGARQLLYQSLQANPEYCQSHFLLGTIYMKDGNGRAAVTEFKKSVHGTCVSNVEAHYQLALAYAKIKQYDKARSEYMLLIDQYPQTLQGQHAGDQLKNIP